LETHQQAFALFAVVLALIEIYENHMEAITEDFVCTSTTCSTQRSALGGYLLTGVVQVQLNFA